MNLFKNHIRQVYGIANKKIVINRNRCLSSFTYDIFIRFY